MRIFFTIVALTLFAGLIGLAGPQISQTSESEIGWTPFSPIAEETPPPKSVGMWSGNVLGWESRVQPIIGRVVGIDFDGKNLFVIREGAFQDTRHISKGAASVEVLSFEGKELVEQLRLVKMNDKVAIQAQEEITKSQPFGTGRKMVREFYVLERKSKGETVHTFGTPVSILSPSRPVGGAGVKTIRNAAPCWGCGDMNLIPMKIK